MENSRARAKTRKKYLDRTIREVLEEVISLLPGEGFAPILEYGHPRTEAIDHLIQLGVLVEVSFVSPNSGNTETRQKYVELTVKGWDYWDKLTAPRWYWLRQNAFAASVAFATILFAGASTIVNVINLVL